MLHNSTGNHAFNESRHHTAQLVPDAVYLSSTPSLSPLRTTVHYSTYNRLLSRAERTTGRGFTASRAGTACNVHELVGRCTFINERISAIETRVL